VARGLWQHTRGWLFADDRHVRLADLLQEEGQMLQWFYDLGIMSVPVPPAGSLCALEG
jgi:hypothetical protein